MIIMFTKNYKMLASIHSNILQLLKHIYQMQHRKIIKLWQDQKKTILIISDQSVSKYIAHQNLSDIIIQAFMPKIHITIVPKEIGQLWDQILEDILNDVCNPSHLVPHLPLTELIPHKYNSKYNLYQGKCHQQTTSNLCGYHATFNTLCFLNFVRRGESHYDINSGASFWRFKRSIEQFLFGMKKRLGKGEEWPWRESDILYGDFQRTYNKLCLQQFHEFEIFRRHQQFELYSFTWQFQYQNLIISEQKKRQLNKMIQYFKSYKKNKPLVISFMLGIDVHWMCLQAVKVGNYKQYWFFDSFNRDVLDLSEQQIYQFVDNLNRQRVSLKKQPFSEYFKRMLPVCFKDTQITLKLLIDCLEGVTTIDQYVYNQQFNIFAIHLQQYWQNDQLRFQTTVKQYWYNITSFLRLPVQFHLFSPENHRRFKKLVEVLKIQKLHSQQSKRLYQLVKKYEITICI